jgi:hypothetical protein
MPAAIQGNIIVAQNNIFDLGSEESIRFNVSSLTENHNLFVYGQATAGSTIGDPHYVDAANGNFHLQSGSDCIDKGIGVGIQMDLDAAQLNSNNPSDIGPYEYKTAP